jgi:hypothetical protein
VASIYDWAIKVTGSGGFKFLQLGVVMWFDEFDVGSLRLVLVP